MSTENELHKINDYAALFNEIGADELLAFAEQFKLEDLKKLALQLGATRG